MLVICGTQMMPPQQEKLTNYVNVGENWLHKVLSLAISPMPPNLAGHKGKASHHCYSLFCQHKCPTNFEGRPYLGTAIGTEEFVISYVKNRVAKWIKELDSLATIALSQPHAAHAAFTHGLSSMWSYLTHTIHGIGRLLQTLETIIRSKLIPALTGQPPTPW